MEDIFLNFTVIEKVAFVTKVKMQNKTDSVIEVKLSESTLNNKKIIDIDKRTANSWVSLAGERPPYEDETHGDIILNPREDLEMVVAVDKKDQSEVNFRIKYVINGKIDYLCEVSKD